MSTDLQCHRCGRDVEHRPNYPGHLCGHGNACTAPFTCFDCAYAYDANGAIGLKGNEERVRELRRQVSASLNPSPLAAIGGQARSGIAKGSETARRK